MRFGRAAVGITWLVSSLVVACTPEDEVAAGEERAGGDATTESTTRDAYTHEVDGLSATQHTAFVVGRSFFESDWVTAPASAAGRDGLGPLYNATRCTACHVRGGRGRLPDAGEEMLSAIVRVSIAGPDAHGAPLAEPTYGGQLSPRAVLGIAPEVTTRTRWIETPDAFADGVPFSLRAPQIDLALAYGPLAEDAMTSVRVAPPLVGLGLLEAIPDEAILALADPDDADHDGVSGRASRVWDEERGAWRLGRFGWKASAPDLRVQTAAALSGDIGITSSLAPSESCTASQTECSAAPRGDDLQASDTIVASIALHVAASAVPARRDAGHATVLRGRALFRDAGCASCHVASFTTGPSDVAALAAQQIWPYTDLLLHDMGEGLADHRPDHDATGLEWRTPPLWGLGLTEVVAGHTFLLHDGRARDVTEAILWHGGEAEAARDAFRAMTSADRQALVRFLDSL